MNLGGVVKGRLVLLAALIAAPLTAQNPAPPAGQPAQPGQQPQTPPPPLPPNGWRLDNGHSAVTFRVRHLGISWVNGQFRNWTADIVYDPANPTAASVTARIQTASVNTNNDRRDNDIRSGNYLAVDSFPEMTFVSRRVERVAPDRLRIHGDLTLRGVTRPVTLDTEVTSVLPGQRVRRIAFTATTTINRHDYGVTMNRLVEGAQVVGDEVRITIDVEATQPVAAAGTGGN
jgi:polyisoprenoid-binding protein YceI